MRKRLRLVSLMIGLALVVLVTSDHSACAASEPPGFHAPVALPGSGGGSEPSVAVAAQTRAGTRFASWQSPGEVVTSTDGVNFTNHGLPDPSGGGDVTNAIDASGAFFLGQFCGGVFELHACLERSLDGGLTWPLHTDFADMHPGASDRPWIEVFPHRSATVPWNPDTTRVYLEYHTFTPEELAYVTVSEDGGQTFSAPKIITSDTNALNGSGCNTIPGGLAVDENDGTVYALWLSGNDVASNAVTGCNYTQIGPFNKAWVSTSTDGGNTWTSHLAWEGVFDQVTKIGDNADKIFPTISVDRAGQVHVVLPVRHNDDPVGFVLQCTLNSGNCAETPQDTDLLLVTSPDQGAHWTPPANIEQSSGSYFFPWTVAGSKGIVNAVYYKSATRQPNKPNSVWYIGFSRVTGAEAGYTGGPNAFYVSPPAFQELLLDPNPVHGNGTSGGGICTFGLFCSGVPGANRALADSIAIALDPAGGVNAVWTDDIGNPGNAREIHFACQNSGASSFEGAPDLNGCYGPADLLLTKTASPDPVAPGADLTFHLTVTNNGMPAMPSTTSGVLLVDTLPAGVTLVSAIPSRGSCFGDPIVTCDLGILPGGASATVDIIAIVSQQASGSLTNSATVGSVTDDPDRDNNTATVTVTVSEDNHQPEAVDDSAITQQNNAVAIPVLANDSDPDGDPFEIFNVTAPSNGAAVDNGDGTITYTPSAGFAGTDTFTYTICDDGGLCDSATVTVTVNPSPPGGPIERVHGSGFLFTSVSTGDDDDDDGGGKLNFDFDAGFNNGSLAGKLKVNDKAVGVKIDAEQITTLSGGTSACNGVAPGPDSFEFTATGKFNGQSGAQFRVCGVDNGDPGKGNETHPPDRLYIECLVGCSYNSASRTPDDGIDGGNIHLHHQGSSRSKAGRTSARAEQPRVIDLEPILLTEGVVGTPQLLIAMVHPDGITLEGLVLTLNWTKADGSTGSASAITDVLGMALFTATVEAGDTEYIVSSGTDLESNAIEITGAIGGF